MNKKLRKYKFKRKMSIMLLMVFLFTNFSQGIIAMAETLDNIEFSTRYKANENILTQDDIIEGEQNEEVDDSNGTETEEDSGETEEDSGENGKLEVLIPQNITTENIDAGIKISWTKTENAIYEIDINGTIINGIDSSEYIFNYTDTENKEFVFKIRCKVAEVYSEWSQEIKHLYTPKKIVETPMPTSEALLR